jgi:phospholipase D-like protein
MGDPSYLKIVALPILMVSALVFFAFWLWMLIDCLAHEPSGTEKVGWIVVLVFAHALGALLYFAIRRPARIAEAKSAAP